MICFSHKIKKNKSFVNFPFNIANNKKKNRLTKNKQGMSQ